jgi:hypothetical protein
LNSFSESQISAGFCAKSNVCILTFLQLCLSVKIFAIFDACRLLVAFVYKSYSDVFPGGIPQIGYSVSTSS